MADLLNSHALFAKFMQASEHDALQFGRLPAQTFSTEIPTTSRDHLPDVMFPRGAPGFAMLMLRVALAAILIIEVFEYNDKGTNLSVFAILVPIEVALVLGFLTSIAAILTALIGIALLLTQANAFAAMEIALVLNAIVVVLLGPGWYSLDACRFGRHDFRQRC